MIDASLACIDGCHADKKQVAAWYEGIGEGVGRLLLIHFYGRVGERVLAETTDERYVHYIESDTGFASYLLGIFYLNHMFLTIGKGEGIYFFEMAFGPKEASGGVLSAAIYH